MPHQTVTTTAHNYIWRLMQPPMNHIINIPSYLLALHPFQLPILFRHYPPTSLSILIICLCPCPCQTLCPSPHILHFMFYVIHINSICTPPDGYFIHERPPSPFQPQPVLYLNHILFHVPKSSPLDSCTLTKHPTPNNNAAT